jgi:hypothetical protein
MGARKLTQNKQVYSVRQFRGLHALGRKRDRDLGIKRDGFYF